MVEISKDKINKIRIHLGISGILFLLVGVALFSFKYTKGNKLIQAIIVIAGFLIVYGIECKLVEGELV